MHRTLAPLICSVRISCTRPGSSSARLQKHASVLLPTALCAFSAADVPW